MRAMPSVAPVEILTEHHENVPFLVKDDEVEVLPNKLLDWPLVPIFWDLFAGLVFLGNNLRGLTVSEEGCSPIFSPPPA